VIQAILTVYVRRPSFFLTIASSSDKSKGLRAMTLEGGKSFWVFHQ
jgi:hypothetical protein